MFVERYLQNNERDEDYDILLRLQRVEEKTVTATGQSRQFIFISTTFYHFHQRYRTPPSPKKQKKTL